MRRGPVGAPGLGPLAARAPRRERRRRADPAWRPPCQGPSRRTLGAAGCGDGAGPRLACGRLPPVRSRPTATSAATASVREQKRHSMTASRPRRGRLGRASRPSPYVSGQAVPACALRADGRRVGAAPWTVQCGPREQALGRGPQSPARGRGVDSEAPPNVPSVPALTDRPPRRTSPSPRGAHGPRLAEGHDPRARDIAGKGSLLLVTSQSEPAAAAGDSGLSVKETTCERRRLRM